MLLNRFYPWETADSVFSIDYEKLYRLGYRGILFDIDNTLVLHGADSNEEVDALFRRLHSMGLQTLLLSNNSEERILRFLAHIESPYIAEADKPAPAAYLQAVKTLGLSREQTIVIGDRRVRRQPRRAGQHPGGLFAPSRGTAFWQTAGR